MATSRLKIFRNAKLFLSINSERQLARLLQIPLSQLQLMLLNQKYHQFLVYKKGGEQRLIEAPNKQLKQVQRKLNKYLQSVYFVNKTENAYGYILNYKNNSVPRNIVTNALQHIKQPYMLNVDLKDFFHQIDEKKIAAVFSFKPFLIKCQKLINTLTALVTFKKRLPMGAPTSPAMSNFATIILDTELNQFAKRNNIKYTRYVDDLTFSSKNNIENSALVQKKKHFIIAPIFCE